MIGLDTNVIIRYLTQDDPVQGKRAAQLIENALGARNIPADKPCFFITSVVLCELVWVLESAYKIPKSEIIEILRKILSTTQFQIQDSDDCWAALKLYRSGKGDFSDYLIGRIGQSAGCQFTATFDHALDKTRDFQVL